MEPLKDEPDEAAVCDELSRWQLVELRVAHP